MSASNPPSRPLIVTIDGPAGAGKTSVSKLLAKKLGYRYIDTGALYRGVAVAARQAGVSAEDDAGLEALCRRIKLDLIPDGDGLRIVLNGADITDRIRTPEISMLSSAVSARPVVRAFLLATQRDLAAPKVVVAEGRYEELNPQAKAGPSLTTVESEMRQRDRNDATRAVAPLQPATDAIRIDSSRLSLAQVVDEMLRHIATIA